MNMQLLIFILFSFALTIKAQLFLPIPCKTQETCNSIIEPAKVHNCANGLCTCRKDSGRIDLCTGKDKLEALKPKGLRRSCLTDEDCDGVEGAVCLENVDLYMMPVCGCKPHLVASADGQSCLTKATDIGARCNETAQCTQLNADCVSEGRCRCRPNHHFALKSKLCTENKAYGASCANEEDSCYQLSDPDGTNALMCSEQVCKCLTNYNYQDGKCQYSAGSRLAYQMSFVSAIVFIAKII